MLAGYTPVKSCSNQTLKLSQQIEHGFQAGMVTGAVFIDLSAAYDTVNLRRLMWKVECIINDTKFVRILRELLHNCRFRFHLRPHKRRESTKKMSYPMVVTWRSFLTFIPTTNHPVRTRRASFMLMTLPSPVKPPSHLSKDRGLFIGCS